MYVCMYVCMYECITSENCYSIHTNSLGDYRDEQCIEVSAREGSHYEDGGGRLGVPTGTGIDITHVCMYVYISNGIASCLDSSCPADERRHSWNSQTDARQ
jgi:hypothetical protein